MNQIKLGTKLSYDDWGIILNSFKVGEAEVKSAFVDIPFGDGALDLTESLTGKVTYGNRDCEFIFTFPQPRSEWETIKRDIMQTIHGKKLNITTPDAPDCYLIARCSASFEIRDRLGVLKVKAITEPYFYKNVPTQTTTVIPVGGSTVVNFTNASKSVIPTFTVNATTTITFKGTPHVVNAGTHKLTDIIFTYGANSVTFAGTATKTIITTYQEGVL